MAIVKDNILYSDNINDLEVLHCPKDTADGLRIWSAAISTACCRSPCFFCILVLGLQSLSKVQKWSWQKEDTIQVPCYTPLYSTFPIHSGLAKVITHAVPLRGNTAQNSTICLLRCHNSIQERFCSETLNTCWSLFTTFRNLGSKNGWKSNLWFIQAYCGVLHWISDSADPVVGLQSMGESSWWISAIVAMAMLRLDPGPNIFIFSSNGVVRKFWKLPLPYYRTGSIDSGHVGDKIRWIYIYRRVQT